MFGGGVAGRGRETGCGESGERCRDGEVGVISLSGA